MISAEQQIRRQGYAGSSDAAAICEADPYRSAADVWLEKTGRASSFEGNEATDAATRLERVVLDWAREQIGRDFATDVMDVGPCGLLAANFDGRSSGHIAEPFIVEAKTTGITGPPDADFGDQLDPTADEPLPKLPERVLIQVHHQFTVAGPEYRLAYVPVLIGGEGFRMYRVRRVDELADAIAERCRDFMSRFVRLGIQPDDFKPTLAVLKRVHRELNKMVELSDELVDRLIVCKSDAKQAEDDLEEAQAAVIAALGDAEGGTYSRGTLTYFSQLQVRIDADRLRERFPDAARACEKEVCFRVLRLPRAAKGRKS